MPRESTDVDFQLITKMTAKLTAHLYLRPVHYFGDDDDMAYLPRARDRQSLPDIERITPVDFLSAEDASEWDGTKASLKEQYPHYVDYCKTLRRLRKYLLRHLCVSKLLRKKVEPFADFIVWSALRGFEKPSHYVLRGSLL
jgi:hypothetical protein